MDFREIQARFTAHVRDPALPVPPGVAAARMAVYAGLVHRNLESLLAGCFPVLHAVLPAARWTGLIREFLRAHRAQTPLFTRVPNEFVRFLAQSDAAGSPGYLRELAHYEWLELEVGYDAGTLEDTRVDAGADPYHDVPVLNPFARPMVYRYPVHRIGPDFVPDAAPPAPTCLVVFRQRDDGVAFAELTPVTARLVELIQHNHAALGAALGAASGAVLLRQIATELAHPQPARLLEQGREILADLQVRELLIGAVFRRK